MPTLATPAETGEISNLAGTQKPAASVMPFTQALNK
jgi:hypothetical protein